MSARRSPPSSRTGASPRAETLLGNTVLPCVVAHACAALEIPWGHVSTGCLYDGAKLKEGDAWRVVKDLNQPKLRELFHTHPERFAGFSEEDEPNFSFRQPPCSFHNGAKALAEEAIRDAGQGYIWRLRIPFDEFDGPRNALSKLQRYPKVYDNINSFSHRGDFARSCLDLWERKAPWGIYNVTNPGAISTRQIIERIQKILRPARPFEFWSGDDEFYRAGVKAPRSNCILDTRKLAEAGVALRPVGEAVEAALLAWRPAAP